MEIFSSPTPTPNPPPWWIIALKVIAYLIGLVLAGYGAANAATIVLASL